jgi:peptidoglycan/xylan/chitin deacetylase (PgdA/CDA1 family)
LNEISRKPTLPSEVLDLTAELILNLHGSGSPPEGVGDRERFFWITQPTLISLLQTVVTTRSISSLPVAITFDDGNESDAAIALPELAKRELRATFFVVAARIGMPHFLDRKALTDLVSAGMEIGTHGMYHRDWRKIDEAALNVEIVDARRRIEDICGIAVTKAAIPFGSYDRRVLRRLRSEPFKHVYTSDGGLAESDAWLMPRQTIDSTLSEDSIKGLVTTYPPLWARLRYCAARIYKRQRAQLRRRRAGADREAPADRIPAKFTWR